MCMYARRCSEWAVDFGDLFQLHSCWKHGCCVEGWEEGLSLFFGKAVLYLAFCIVVVSTKMENTNWKLESRTPSTRPFETHVHDLEEQDSIGIEFVLLDCLSTNKRFRSLSGRPPSNLVLIRSTGGPVPPLCSIALYVPWFKMLLFRKSDSVLRERGFLEYSERIFESLL